MKPLLLVCAALSGVVLLSANLTAAAREPATTATTAAVERIVLVGDSTIASRGGWGGAFAKLVVPGVECTNMGRGGRSSKSYRKEGHWKNVLEAKPTWVLIQFGHND